MAPTAEPPSDPPEFPALLQAGLHPMTLEEVWHLCVDRFPFSATRRAIMEGIVRLCRAIESEAMRCDVWLDGSFLTEKMNPNDADLLFRIPAEAYDSGTPRQRHVIEWVVEEDRIVTHLCDTYVWLEYPPAHRNFAESEETRTYWEHWFGHSRVGHPKGIAVVNINGGAA